MGTGRAGAGDAAKVDLLLRVTAKVGLHPRII
jgi:hypothetical protein